MCFFAEDEAQKVYHFHLEKGLRKLYLPSNKETLLSLLVSFMVKCYRSSDICLILVLKF